MSYDYTTMYDILKNPLSERRNRYGTTQLSYIVIDGNKFGGYKTFSSFWEKTYVKQPERSTSGVLGNLNSYTTFITFHLKVDFSMMSITDYRRLYDLMLDRNEFTVTAYNILTNKPYTCKMYFAPDQMPKLYAVARRLQGEKFIEVLGVQDYTIELIGTNTSLDKVDILYYDNNGNLIPEATQSVESGVETIVNYNYSAPTGYRFDGEWEKENGGIVRNGSIITPNSNISLRAVVVPTNSYSISFDYGIGLKPITQITTEQIDTFKITKGETIGKAISNAGVILSTGNIFSFPQNGTGVSNVSYNGKSYSGDAAYEFKGWYWNINAINEKVTKDTIYNYEANKTIYQIYSAKYYDVYFETNDASINIKNTIGQYGKELNVPNLSATGKIFKGWFWKDGNTEVKFNGIMPPFILYLYAKWE